MDPITTSPTYLDHLWAKFRDDPASVPAEWREVFIAAQQQDAALPQGPHSTSPPTGNGTEAARIQALADDLAHAYRARGHRVASIDPLGMPRSEVPELDPRYYGLQEADLDRPLSDPQAEPGPPLTLRLIVDRLRETYCRSIGVQFMHIDDIEVRTWLQRRMEATQNRFQLSTEMQRRILTRLTDAVLFEEAMRKRYVGAKTFSLEGSETLIPLLDLAIEKAASQGVKEIVMGMAHRGRLNVLANVIGKPVQDIFWEFQDTDGLQYQRGDVRYHLGYSSDWTTALGRTVHMSLCFNPSHLEFVNPVALGRMRAKLDRAGNDSLRGLVVLIHGDAAFAGEGVVQETLNMSELADYSVGGALHVIVNNQIGFTTPPEEGRSSDYATAVAKMLQVPIFHVNGEDPEAAAQVVELALDFRQRYRRDAVIDVYGYRRFGHNEGDEPSFTQPVMYREIERHESVRDHYLENLLKVGHITRQQADSIAQHRNERIQAEFESSLRPEFRPQLQTLGGAWRAYAGGAEPSDDEPDTSIPREQLVSLLEKQTQLPEGFHVHPKLARLFETRRAMARGEKPLDWAAAEASSFGSLALAGHPVRLSGQDSQRGTFSQRHAVLHDYEDGHTYCPLQHLAPDQAWVQFANSPLSEAGVLGFEYGYSLDYPDALVAWEAQFGDFVNAAQVIIDQFLASAEPKWHRLSGLVLLLPHGFEGQGPEHSSARLERFLMLGANDNFQVVQPSTAAQYFHCLRRQVLRRWRKPLIVMTPKSLLRHPASFSSQEDFVGGRFARVLQDAGTAQSPSAVTRVLLCSGKIYYDLLEARDEQQRRDVAILRLEQLYPLPRAELAKALAAFSPSASIVWVQEEPANMGAWQFLQMELQHSHVGQQPWSSIARPAAATPATGSRRLHDDQQRSLVAAALGSRAQTELVTVDSETQGISHDS